MTENVKTSQATSAGEEGQAGTSPKEPMTWRQRTRHVWREWVRPILVVVIVLSTFRSAVADWNDVPTPSMDPTILVGDRILVNKLAYDLKIPFTRVHLAEWGGPCRGEIVVFFAPHDETRMVKRVVGVPGDVIELRMNRLYINGVPMTYETLDGQEVSSLRNAAEVYIENLDGVRHTVQLTPRTPASRTFGPVTVPPGHYFMMGDNRDNSFDSRGFGFVERNRIVGRSSRVALSLDSSRYYLPRWSRFFHALP